MDPISALKWVADNIPDHQGGLVSHDSPMRSYCLNGPSSFVASGLLPVAGFLSF